MSETNLSEIIEKVKKHIQSIHLGQRIQYRPNMNILMEKNSDDLNWDYIEEIQMEIRGPMIPQDLFITLRFDKDYTDLVIDFYRPIFHTNFFD